MISFDSKCINAAAATVVFWVFMALLDGFSHYYDKKNSETPFLKISSVRTQKPNCARRIRERRDDVASFFFN
jgi:hypothetical protein